MRRSAAIVSIVLLGALAIAAGRRRRHPPLRTVDHVDLRRYAGTWYEIARFPKRYERRCTGSTATYTLREDGEVGVRNQCRVGSLDGPEKAVEGRARVVDPATGAKLEVRFFWPFWSAYWILDLGPEYEYAVVGHPNRESLWILSREPTMPESLYQAIVGRLEERGFETRRLVRTLQARRAPAGWAPFATPSPDPARS